MLRKTQAVEIDDDFNLTAKQKTKRPTMSLDDDEPVIKAKTTELSVLEQPSTKKKKKIEPATVSAASLRTIFGDDADEMIALLEDGDSDDSALSKLNKRLIQSSINIIAEVEQGIHESKGRYGVHSYNGLVQTIRELVIDLQSSKDRGAIGLTITEQILRPSFLDIGMKLMEEYAKVAHDIKDLIGADEYKEFRTSQLESRERIASFLQDQYSKMRDETVKFLQR